MQGDEQYRFVFKTETDQGPTRLISLVIYDLDRGQLHHFGGPGQPSIQEGAEILDLADVVISHSMYHFKALINLCSVTLDRTLCGDTAAMAKNQWHHPANGLDAWAQRLGYRRQRFHGGDQWSAQAEARCERDVIMIADLYGRLTDMVPA